MASVVLEKEPAVSHACEALSLCLNSLYKDLTFVLIHITEYKF